ncbi:MAG: 3-deoxy-manno-octulosonate cytidylyltransferase [Opitutales bacterium]|nr:3-deoxy-manno-octulosonate cytidylyltransferase [Opitutales bacterium]
MSESFSVVIPARMASSRLPGKMLSRLAGKPVLQHVIERVRQVRLKPKVYVVTDSEEIVRLAQSMEVVGLMTSPDCTCGTERIASVLEKIPGDIIFNVQGDEPFMDPRLMESMMEYARTMDADVLMPLYELKTVEAVWNPAIAKVVCDANGRALYFSRSPIPYVRDCEPSHWLEQNHFWGTFGIYGFRRESLEAYRHFSQSPCERAESLEQLRWIANGYQIATFRTENPPLSIDTAEDLKRAEAMFHS